MTQKKMGLPAVGSPIFFVFSEESLGEDPPDPRQIDIAKQLMQNGQDHGWFLLSVQIKTRISTGTP